MLACVTLDYWCRWPGHEAPHRRCKHHRRACIWAGHSPTALQALCTYRSPANRRKCWQSELPEILAWHLHADEYTRKVEKQSTIFVVPPVRQRVGWSGMANMVNMAHACPSLMVRVSSTCRYHEAIYEINTYAVCRGLVYTTKAADMDQALPQCAAAEATPTSVLEKGSDTCYNHLWQHGTVLLSISTSCTVFNPQPLRNNLGSLTS
jgi:hypothetical protein